MRRADLEHIIRAAATIAMDDEIAFLKSAARHGLVSRATLLERVAETDLVPEVRALVLGRIGEAFPGS